MTRTITLKQYVEELADKQTKNKRKKYSGSELVRHIKSKGFKLPTDNQFKSKLFEFYTVCLITSNLKYKY